MFNCFRLKHIERKRDWLRETVCEWMCVCMYVRVLVHVRVRLCVFVCWEKESFIQHKVFEFSTILPTLFLIFPTARFVWIACILFWCFGSAHDIVWSHVHWIISVIICRFIILILGLRLDWFFDDSLVFSFHRSGVCAWYFDYCFHYFYYYYHSRLIGSYVRFIVLIFHFHSNCLWLVVVSWFWQLIFVHFDLEFTISLFGNLSVLFLLSFSLSRALHLSPICLNCLLIGFSGDRFI